MKQKEKFDIVHKAITETQETPTPKTDFKPKRVTYLIPEGKEHNED